MEIRVHGFNVEVHLELLGTLGQLSAAPFYIQRRQKRELNREGARENLGSFDCG
jgi:hypothetical protein